MHLPRSLQPPPFVLVSLHVELACQLQNDILHLPALIADLSQAPVAAQPACTVMLDNSSLDVVGVAREMFKSRHGRHNPLASL